MTPFSVVNALTGGMNQSIPLPWAARMSFQGLNILHYGWWFLKQNKIYFKGKNALPLLFGHGGNIWIQNPYLRFGAKCLLVIDRGEECWTQTFRLVRSYRKLHHCLTGRYSTVVKPKWSTKTSEVFSLHFQNSKRQKLKALKALAYRIFFCIFDIFRSLSKLGMRLWDAYDAFYAENEAMQQAVVNGMKWLEKIGNNQEFYIEKLRKSKPYVENIISCLHLSIKAEDVIHGCEEAINKTASVANIVNTVSEASGESITKLVKRSLTVGGAALGMLQDVPESMEHLLVLDNEPGWNKQLMPEPPVERFPKIQWKPIPKPPVLKRIKKRHIVPIKDKKAGLCAKQNLPEISDKERATLIKLLQMYPNERKWTQISCN